MEYIDDLTGKGHTTRVPAEATPNLTGARTSAVS
jgi:hypothetical protein